jgi:hypothetical protein
MAAPAVSPCLTFSTLTLDFRTFSTLALDFSTRCPRKNAQTPFSTLQLCWTRHAQSGRPPGGGFFEIHVRGHLDGKWSDWLEGLEVKLLANGVMILSGYIVDQAALMGVLDKLTRLNLTLLSVREVNQQE